jgi:3',5'-cyclic AMP phosphodiesterase CpdA
MRRSLPMVLIQVGDLHIGADWVPTDPRQTLAATVDAILRLRLPIEAVLALGDLAEHGADAEYDAARAELQRLGAPIHPVMGNRDDRRTLRRHFGRGPESEAPVCYATDLGAVRLVVLDTTIPGRDAGHVDPDAVAWLDHECSGHPDTPTLLAMHHPPLLTGSPAWDRIALSARARNALAEVLDAHPQIRGILGAHLHRPLFAQFASRPLVVGPSTYVQFPLNLDAVELDPADEPPACVVHLIADDARLISSVQTGLSPAGGR